MSNSLNAIRWKKALISIILFLTALCGLSAVAERDTVHIGFFKSENYGFIGADGDLRGYDILGCDSFVCAKEAVEKIEEVYAK